MENIVIKGKVTATSNKVDGKFKQEEPTKTAYLTIAEEDKKKAVEFGLREYTSSEDGNIFFIVKLPKNVALYVEGVKSASPELMSGSVATNNFKTTDEYDLSLNIIKGENLGNVFYRLQAIQITKASDITEIKPENPFG